MPIPCNCSGRSDDDLNCRPAILAKVSLFFLTKTNSSLEFNYEFHQSKIMFDRVFLLKNEKFQTTAMKSMYCSIDVSIDNNT